MGGSDGADVFALVSLVSELERVVNSIIMASMSLPKCYYYTSFVFFLQILVYSYLFRHISFYVFTSWIIKWQLVCKSKIVFPSDIYVYGKELKYMWDWDKKNLGPIAEDQQCSAKRRSVSNFRAVVTEKLKDHR